jgi:hypothetical protein
LQKITSEILDFITQNSETVIIQPPADFPNSPFDYLFLPERKIVLHCVTLNIKITDPLFFQQLTNTFANQNIKLIHIWSDLWQTKQEIIKSRIVSFLGKSDTIPARLTQVRRIDKKMADRFLIDNHLQSTVGAKLKYGLFLPQRYFRVISQNYLSTHSIIHSSEILVAVATFSNAKKIIRDGKEFRSYEMIRFANLKEITVVGGLNKLLKNFIKEQNPDDIMTYADGDWSDGKNYEKIGFERIEQTLPLTFILDNQSLERSLSTNNTQVQKIYNAGNWKFLMKLKHD